MAPRAVADTNVLVAAAIAPRGTCGRWPTAAIEGGWRLVCSPLLVAELDAVLARAKSRRWLSIEDARTFVRDVRVLAELVADPPASPVPMTPDPKDEFVVGRRRELSGPGRRLVAVG